MRTIGFKQQKWAPYIFISPFFILTAIFGLYPIIYSFLASFHDVKLNPGPWKFIGLNNYVNLLTIDPFFWLSLWNTVILLVFGSMLQHIIAIPLAILINSKTIKGKEFFKTTYFLPYITSTVSVVLIFGNLFDTEYGLINWMLSWFDIEKVKWGGEAIGIKVVLSTILNWKFIGWNMIIYLAGLQAIPQELYEAAEMDGATGWQKHLHVTLPQLAPIMFFAMALSIIGGMQIFEEPFLFTGQYDQLGGNQNSGLTSAFYLMFTAFKAYRLGKGSALAWILFIIIMLMNAVNRSLTKNKSN